MLRLGLHEPDRETKKLSLLAKAGIALVCGVPGLITWVAFPDLPLYIPFFVSLFLYEAWLNRLD